MLLFRLLGLAALVYVGLAALLFFRQRSLLFQPARLTAAELEPLAAGHRFLPWTNAVGTRIGWWRAPLGPRLPGSILITHGNAGSAVGRDYLADPIQAAVAMDVFILDYPGYADRVGEPSEASLLAAATEGFGDLAARPGPVLLVGESLGSGVASYLAGKFPDRVTGACLLVPFNRLDAAAAAHYPWLPVRLLLRDRFPSEQWLKNFHGPLAVLVGEADAVIPAELGRKLFAGYTGPKRFWSIPGENHWDAIVQPVEVWIDLLNFLRAPQTGSASAEAR